MSADTPDGLDENDPRIASLISYARKQDHNPKSPPRVQTAAKIIGLLVLWSAFVLFEYQSLLRRFDRSLAGYYNIPEASSLDVVEGTVIEPTKMVYYGIKHTKHTYYANIETDDGAVMGFQCPVVRADFEEVECFYRNAEAEPAGMIGQRVRVKLFYLPGRHYDLRPVAISDGGMKRLVQPEGVGVLMQATEFLDGREYNILSYRDEAAQLRAYQAENQPRILMGWYSWLDRLGIKHPPIPTTEISVTRP